MRICPSNEPRILELHGGAVTITVKPSNSVLRTAARAKAQAAVTRLKDGGEVMTEYGFGETDYDLLDDTFIMLGFSQLMYAVELGERLITEWSGYEDEKDNALPVNRDTIVAVMKQDAEQFLNKEAVEADRVAREGNVSPLSRTGTGEGAENTAKAASAKKPTAPKENAE